MHMASYLHWQLNSSLKTLGDFGWITSNLVPHLHSNPCHSRSKSSLPTQSSRSKIIGKVSEFSSFVFDDVPICLGVCLMQDLMVILCTFYARRSWAAQHAAHNTSTIVTVVKYCIYCSSMYREKCIISNVLLYKQYERKEAW